jgi:stage V sporulation protein SpoVS
MFIELENPEGYGNMLLNVNDISAVFDHGCENDVISIAMISDTLSGVDSQVETTESYDAVKRKIQEAINQPVTTGIVNKPIGKKEREKIVFTAEDLEYMASIANHSHRLYWVLKSEYGSSIVKLANALTGYSRKLMRAHILQHKSIGHSFVNSLIHALAIVSGYVYLDSTVGRTPVKVLIEEPCFGKNPMGILATAKAAYPDQDLITLSDVLTFKYPSSIPYFKVVRAAAASVVYRKANGSVEELILHIKGKYKDEPIRM